MRYGLLLFCLFYVTFGVTASENDSVVNINFADSLEIEFSNSRGRDLKELVVKRKKEKYSKKNNPALEMMRRLKKNHKNQNSFLQPHYSYKKYDKTIIAVNDFDFDFENSNGSFAKKMKFLADYVDTARWTGKRILNLSVKEKISSIFGGENKKRVEVIEGLRSVGIDEAFNQENIRKIVEDLVREVDLSKNDITLLQNRFVSPLADIAPDFYKYEITDTLPVGGIDCVELSFYPHNPQSMGFNGKIYVAEQDGIEYIKRVSMRMPKAANVNYVDNLFITQNYVLDEEGKFHKTLDDVCLEFSVMPNTPKIYANRVSIFDEFYAGKNPYSDEYGNSLAEEILLPNAGKQSPEYWVRNRPFPLTMAQSKLGDMMSNFRRSRFFYWAEKVVLAFINGYVTTGNPSKVDIGPVNTMLSYNNGEGLRIRMGGITTCSLSPNLFGRGYIAYGFKDRKIKYSGEIEYSFSPKRNSPREFPVNSVRASYTYDVDNIGQLYMFTNPDNVFLSLKRLNSTLLTYRRLAKVEYNREYANNLSFGIELRNEEQEATRWVPFVSRDGRAVKSFKQSALKLQIRYAPGEKYVQGMTIRRPIHMDAPIFLVSHEIGPKGMFGSDFSLNKTELSVQKRFWFSAFGYTDIIVKGGILWDKVPFPALLWQNANLSYTIQPESYSLLNPMEFAMDKYASLDLSYFSNGLIFNHIPYLNRLKLREVFTFKGFYGSLSNKNNPDYNENIFRFPVDANTKPMGNKPYMEIGVGLDNILTVLRVDYVWRLTYRDYSGIDKSGLRVSLHFSF